MLGLKQIEANGNRDVVYSWLQTWVQLGPHVKEKKKKKKETLVNKTPIENIRVQMYVKGDHCKLSQKINCLQTLLHINLNFDTNTISRLI